MRVFTQPKNRRKLTVSTLIATAITVKQYLKLWVATITSAHAKKLVHFCQNNIFEREIKEREMDELRRQYVKKKVKIFSKCGKVSGGSNFQQIVQ